MDANSTFGAVKCLSKLTATRCGRQLTYAYAGSAQPRITSVMPMEPENASAINLEQLMNIRVTFNYGRGSNK